MQSILLYIIYTQDSFIYTLIVLIIIFYKSMTRSQYVEQPPFYFFIFFFVTFLFVLSCVACTGRFCNRQKKRKKIFISKNVTNNKKKSHEDEKCENINRSCRRVQRIIIWKYYEEDKGYLPSNVSSSNVR